MVDLQPVNKVRVGVIGLGFGGETILRAYSNLPQVEVVALAGLEEDRLELLGKNYQVPHLYRFYEELLERDDLDAVSIGVPNFLHAPIALAALERGLHVLCEKPLAHTLKDAEAMVEAATKANRVLQVVFNHRERGDVHVLKRYIDEGKLGKIYYAKAYWMRRRGIPGVGSWFVNKEKSGGGPLIDLGVHMLDMALYLLDEPEIKTLSATTYSELGSKGVGFNLNAGKHEKSNNYNVEDLATAFMRLSTGATLTLEASWATHSSFGDDYGIILYGTEGGAEIKVQNYSTEDTLRIYTDVAGAPATINPRVSRGEYHQAVARQFIENINSGNWSLHNGSEGLRRARVIDACYTSAQQGREVALDA
ncbi:oxidoreductase [Ktedonobacter sp. SOSP1-85]|uniref:Oxidoreductase n=1 Tax=Ktedonobacter robiniae TaxID=2778365 RepID=A0ABQ3UJB8_9CHLR|nr:MULTISPECIES: Gfo/Idh/MocA family oxidoreductase [Ktedonobacter]GHO52730.1 oxidoreductase [Ktedonobacter robiniae]GHO75691.1 oxidoreductase [Ktedonobacter sp. SOSP1-85]